MIKDLDKNVEMHHNRDSSIELFRILSMLIIVSHHFVVNSGLIDKLNSESSCTINSIFLLLFGWGGKTGINCFVMITGYFMCKSKITLKKFLKLFLEIKFYRITIYIVFLLTGYTNFEIKGFIKMILPISNVGVSFTPSFLVFYLFIPFLNILIDNLSEKKHLYLIGYCILIYTIFGTFLKTDIAFSYVSWFIVIYFIASYIRLYPKKWFDNKKICGIAFFISLVFSWLSVLGTRYVLNSLNYYYFVADSNKILALVTAFFAFLFFKNINLKYNKIINTIAASSFSVLLIHSSSNDMRRWLWKDVVDAVGHYDSKHLIAYAFISVIVIYIVCTVIDIIRINLLEKPIFKLYDMKIQRK